MSYDEAKEFWESIIPEERKRRKRVFVSFPFADNPAVNRLQNLELLYVLREKYDHLFISPLLLFGYLDTDEGNREDIMAYCKGMISYLSDELWSFGTSEGCMMEREFAKKAGVPVYILRKEDLK